MANFTLYDVDSAPLNVSGDQLALVVFPTPPVSGSVPVIEKTEPLVSVNVVVFEVPDAETGTLTADKPYTWQLLRSPSGTTGTTTVMVGGPLNVDDSPPYPYA